MRGYPTLAGASRNVFARLEPSNQARLIPAGTGMEHYRKVRLATEMEALELIGAEEGEEARPQPSPLDFLVDEEERPTM